jgi:hypothetical protein
MTKEQFFAICPGATWQDELSDSAWEAALRDMQAVADAQNERLAAALLGIAYMDVYTRPGEQSAAELMREVALRATEQKGEP